MRLVAPTHSEPRGEGEEDGVACAAEGNRFDESAIAVDYRFGSTAHPLSGKRAAHRAGGHHDGAIVVVGHRGGASRGRPMVGGGDGRRSPG